MKTSSTHPVSGHGSDAVAQVGVGVVPAVAGHRRVPRHGLGGGAVARRHRRVGGGRRVARLLGSRQRCF